VDYLVEFQFLDVDELTRNKNVLFQSKVHVTEDDRVFGADGEVVGMATGGNRRLRVTIDRPDDADKVVFIGCLFDFVVVWEWKVDFLFNSIAGQ
jgi:hypothetical protein